MSVRDEVEQKGWDAGFSGKGLDANPYEGDRAWIDRTGNLSAYWKNGHKAGNYERHQQIRRRGEEEQRGAGAGKTEEG